MEHCKSKPAGRDRGNDITTGHELSLALIQIGQGCSETVEMSQGRGLSG